MTHTHDDHVIRQQLKCLSRNGASALIRQVLSNRKRANPDTKELVTTIGADFWKFIPNHQHKLMHTHYPSTIIMLLEINKPSALDAFVTSWFINTVKV